MNIQSQSNHRINYGVLALAMFCSLSWATLVHAYPDKGGNKMQQIAQELELTADQRQTLKKMHVSGRKHHKELRDEIRANHKALEALKPSDKHYKKKLLKLAHEQGELTAERVIQQGKGKAKVWAILTSEQRHKLIKMRKKHARSGEHRPGF